MHGPSAETLPLGTRARATYRDYRLFKRANYPPSRVALLPGIKQFVLLVAALWLAWHLGPAARQVSGRGIAAQLRDLLRLGFRRGIDPVTYYLQEFYRSEARADADNFLTRYETKNGLFSALNHMRPTRYARSEMTDKLLFAQCCERFGLPSPQVLLTAEGGRIDWRTTDPAALDRDLFAKQRGGKGARGACAYRYVAPGGYATRDGLLLDRAGLLADLAERSREAPLVLQPALANHPAIADFAETSLIVIRVFTCLDARDEPVVTHAMLRVLGKLEPSWGTKEEFGTAIDLDNGRFGPLAGDRLENTFFRYRLHPYTGAPILGRLFEGWPAVRDLAIAAHRNFTNRIVIGWDIAYTPAGPLLLEGNNVPDVAFLQRVHGRPIGKSPLGPLLHHHLTVLCAARDAARQDHGGWPQGPWGAHSGLRPASRH